MIKNRPGRPAPRVFHRTRRITYRVSSGRLPYQMTRNWE